MSKIPLRLTLRPGIEHLDVQPAITDEKKLEALTLRLLTPADGHLIERSTLVTCGGELKALYLKAETHQPIRVSRYNYALKALRLMAERKAFKPSKDSDRPMIRQNLIGGELLAGWLRPRNTKREDWLRKADRNHLFLAMRLVPLMRDCEWAMRNHLHDYYWNVHLPQAYRMVRPPDQKFKTLHKVKDPFQRMMLERWDATRYYHFLGTQAFSTLTLNYNILFGAHDDGSNAPGTLGCLTALGDYVKGSGLLCFPRLGVMFDLRPGNLLIADTNTEYHATVGGIIGERYSVVAYLHKTLLPKKVNGFGSRLPRGMRQ